MTCSRLTPFEEATLEQLVSFKAKDESDIRRYMNSEELKLEVKSLVQLWDRDRLRKGLKPWNV